MDYLQNKKILVTGASGFLGSNFINICKSVPGIQITGTFFNTPPRIQQENINHIKADLNDYKKCVEVTQNIDYVFMFANTISRGVAGNRHLINNLNITFQILEASSESKVKKVVFVSSATVYPQSSEPLREEDNCSLPPTGFYRNTAIVTKAIEDICKIYSTIDIAILRLTAIYGPGDRFTPDSCHVLASLINQVVADEKQITLLGDGLQKRDFIYVDDVVRACLLACEKTMGYEIYNIGSGEPVTIKDLLQIILKLENKTHIKIITRPSVSDSKPTEIIVDCSKAKKLLGFKPLTSLTEGVKKTIFWYSRGF